MSNEASYQKFDGASGTYQEIPNGDEKRSRRTKFLVAAALLVAIGVVYGAVSVRNSPKKAVDKALDNSHNIEVKANGKLKLSDNLSTLPFPRIFRGCVRKIRGQIRRA